MGFLSPYIQILERHFKRVLLVLCASHFNNLKSFFCSEIEYMQLKIVVKLGRDITI
jgi:hypothetical protein